MAFESFSLTNKTALITGAAGLLGIEHAASLLESGANIVITDVNKVALESVKTSLSEDFAPDRIILKIMDVSSLKSIRENAHDLTSDGLSIDVLINNAAIDPKVSSENGLQETSRFECFPLDQWNMQVSVGLTGAFLCSQVFGSLMADSGHGGVILNIASDLSVIAPDQRLYQKDGLRVDKQSVKPVTYSVIKTGLIGLTLYLSTYWTDKGVRCNALSPGGVLNGQSEEFVQRISRLIPLGRMATRNEYRAAVQFLCSDASSYMNGQNIVMDGGRSAW